MRLYIDIDKTAEATGTVADDMEFIIELSRTEVALSTIAVDTKDKSDIPLLVSYGRDNGAFYIDINREAIYSILNDPCKAKIKNTFYKNNPKEDIIYATN